MNRCNLQSQRKITLSANVHRKKLLFITFNYLHGEIKILRKKVDLQIVSSVQINF